jgi:hypothetical protein
MRWDEMGRDQRRRTLTITLASAAVSGRESSDGTNVCETHSECSRTCHIRHGVRVRGEEEKGGPNAWMAHAPPPLMPPRRRRRRRHRHPSHLPHLRRWYRFRSLLFRSLLLHCLRLHCLRWLMTCRWRVHCERRRWRERFRARAARGRGRRRWWR